MIVNQKKEPIVIALSENNGELVEKLVDCGADASNKHFPVVEKYLQSSFYKFETLKKMKKYNLSLGTPLQTAFENDRMDAAVFLWEITTDNEMRILLSKSIDENHHTPLLSAIYKKDEYFVDQLIQPNFDISTPDNDGKTPLILLYENKMNKCIEKNYASSYNRRN